MAAGCWPTPTDRHQPIKGITELRHRQLEEISNWLGVVGPGGKFFRRLCVCLSVCVCVCVCVWAVNAFSLLRRPVRR